ncbi:MAG: hypothetical protein HY293_05850 [Planctomycetes bacterium]|nr:hypothetical protein [Planctomycetota bacterium]
MRNALIAIWLVLPLTSACASSYMRDGTPTGPPGPDESKVVVYRKSSITGSNITFPVYDGEKLLGFSEYGSYFEYRCRPGKHLFMSWGGGGRLVEATLAGGKTYYLESYSKFGGWMGKPGFDPIGRAHEDWPTVEKIVAGLTCRRVIPEKALEHEARKGERAQKFREEHAEGKRDAYLLEPEDGKPESPAPLPKVSP